MNSVSSALEYFFGSYPVAVALIFVGACWLVWRISAKITKMQDRVNEIDNLPCKDHRDSLAKHDEVIGSLREDIKEVKVKVDFLVGMVNAGQARTLSSSMAEFSDKHSPRTLNESGEALYSEFSGDKFLDANQDFLIDEIDKLAPKSALDVENFALGVLRVHSNDDIFIPLKNWVYRAPSIEVKGNDGSTTKKDVTLDDVLFILSLPLRDRYLKLHPALDA